MYIAAPVNMDGVTSRSEITIAQQSTEGSTIATEAPSQQKEGQSVMVRVELTPGFNGSKFLMK